MNVEKIWSSTAIETEDCVGIIEESMSYFGDLLKEHLKEDYILIDAKNVNWRGQSGYKKVSNYNANSLELAQSILPSYDTTVELFKEENSLFAMVYSHDVPTGSKWSIKGLIDAQDTFNSITDDAIRENEDLESFFGILKEKMSIDLESWSKKDVTSSYHVNRGEKVLSFYPPVEKNGVTLNVFVVEDNIVSDFDFCEDSLEDYYITHIVSH